MSVNPLLKFVLIPKPQDGWNRVNDETRGERKKRKRKERKSIKERK